MIGLSEGGKHMSAEKTLRTCEKGHQFYKSSDCKSCPICDKESKPETGFLSIVSSPVRRALLSEGIDTLEKLSEHTQKEILALHGIGPSSIPVLKASLEEENLDFKS